MVIHHAPIKKDLRIQKTRAQALRTPMPAYSTVVTQQAAATSGTTSVKPCCTAGCEEDQMSRFCTATAQQITVMMTRMQVGASTYHTSWHAMSPSPRPSCRETMACVTPTRGDRKATKPKKPRIAMSCVAMALSPSWLDICTTACSFPFSNATVNIMGRAMLKYVGTRLPSRQNSQCKPGDMCGRPPSACERDQIERSCARLQAKGAQTSVKFVLCPSRKVQVQDDRKDLQMKPRTNDTAEANNCGISCWCATRKDVKLKHQTLVKEEARDILLKMLTLSVST
mmetsp:Transcript_11341/g.21347  ORF Transcript_11341/g.21347 Transcript_11341/m.21347 type:complete len:283 (+) Transcript_11341:388-1236(+)